MADSMATTTNASKVALYQGLIALAWADHDLHENEKATLHHIISSHKGLTEADRQVLHVQVDQPVKLADVWPHITDPQDRARLIDFANTIFQQDDEFCDDERALIEAFHHKHLASIGGDAVAKDLRAFASRHKDEMNAQRAEYRDWARQYGLFATIQRGFSKL